MSKDTALLALLGLVIDGLNIGVAVAKEGKVSVADLPKLMTLIPDLEPAFADIGDVPTELSQLDEQTAADVVAFVMQKLQIADAHATAVANAALKAAVSVFELVKAIKG